MPQPDQNLSLAAAYHSAITHSLSVALWRYPGDETSHAVVDFSGKIQPCQLDLTTLPPGFLFSPFVNRGQALFIKADFNLPSEREEQTKRTYTMQERINRAHFFESYYALRTRRQPDEPKWFTPQTSRRVLLNQAAFCGLVQAAIHEIKSSRMKKIVVSRIVETTLQKGFDPVQSFMRLCECYPHLFVSLVAIPGVGTWMGASPEHLLTMNDNTLKLLALAGTQPKPPGLPLEAISWQAKEIHEQALVVEYIRSFLQQRGIEWQEEGPQTSSAGNIVHLQTKFRVSVETSQPFELANQVLSELHPTSAICGMPLQKALPFILEHEKHERRFYCGFLGPVHLAQSSHLFVNIRCMELIKDKAYLYVGNGITHDSVPSAEWAETILKSQTLLPVLQNGR
jgi:isochorismate synthase